MISRTRDRGPLYLIEILHQTTTNSDVTLNSGKLYLIEILHQTTTLIRSFLPLLSCILSKFYIKPQHADSYLAYWDVVSYRNSTSNHNSRARSLAADIVVSYRNSTSNHNFGLNLDDDQKVVSYRNSTSNHNADIFKDYDGNVVSYRNSTSNHNVGPHID